MSGARIHPLSSVDPSAEVGDGTTVAAFAVVGPGVRLGRDNEVRAHAVVQGPGTTVGDRNVFFEGSIVGSPPQDKKFHGEDVRLEVGDDNHFREHVTVHRGTRTGGGITRVGSRNLLLVGSHVAHDCTVGSDVVLSNHVLLAGHVLVDDREKHREAYEAAGVVFVHHKNAEDSLRQLARIFPSVEVPA